MITVRCDIKFEQLAAVCIQIMVFWVVTCVAIAIVGWRNLMSMSSGSKRVPYEC
jgi:hypothetical protein